MNTCIHKILMHSFIFSIFYFFPIFASAHTQNLEGAILSRIQWVDEKYGMRHSGLAVTMANGIVSCVSLSFEVQEVKETDWLRKTLLEAVTEFASQINNYQKPIDRNNIQIIIFCYNEDHFLSRVAEISDGRLSYQTYYREHETEYTESYDEALSYLRFAATTLSM